MPVWYDSSLEHFHKHGVFSFEHIKEDYDQEKKKLKYYLVHVYQSQYIIGKFDLKFKNLISKFCVQILFHPYSVIPGSCLQANQKGIFMEDAPKSSVAWFHILHGKPSAV